MEKISPSLPGKGFELNSSDRAKNEGRMREYEGVGPFTACQTPGRKIKSLVNKILKKHSIDFIFL